MEWLSMWLLCVAFCRLSAVYFGFFQVWALNTAVFSKLKLMQPVHGRTFGVWTLLTCLLCVITAFNLDNEELYLVTFLSFVFALGYFLLECFVYDTMAVKDLSTMIFFAGGSITWMSLEWNKHHGNAVKPPSQGQSHMIITVYLIKVREGPICVCFIFRGVKSRLFVSPVTMQIAIPMVQW